MSPGHERACAGGNRPETSWSAAPPPSFLQGASRGFDKIGGVGVSRCRPGAGDSFRAYVSDQGLLAGACLGQGLGKHEQVVRIVRKEFVRPAGMLERRL